MSRHRRQLHRRHRRARERERYIEELVDALMGDAMSWMLARRSWMPRDEEPN